MYFIIKVGKAGIIAMSSWNVTTH